MDVRANAFLLLHYLGVLVLACLFAAFFWRLIAHEPLSLGLTAAVVLVSWLVCGS